MDTTLIVVRAFEALSLILFAAGLVWVIRQHNPFYLGAYLGSCFAGVYFDWINNLNWFLRVKFDERFLPLYYLAGWPQPLAMSTTYAFYFGLPVLLLLHHQAALQRRAGRWGQYPLVFFAGAIALPIFEIPMVQAFRLWTYYQKAAFLLGGVAWTNWFYSALLFLLIYIALQYVQPTIAGSDTGATLSTAARFRAGVVGFGAFVTAFAVAQCLQMIIYAITDPWIPSPRPF
jgi:hypothetical protein